MVHTWLLSSGGRRGALVSILRKSSLEDSPAKVITIDNSSLCAAGILSDEFHLVPRVSEPGFLDYVLAICIESQVDVVIPTIDPEIAIYSQSREKFIEKGIDVWVSSPQVAELGWDKWKLHNWLINSGFPSPKTFEYSQNLQNFAAGKFVAKPRNGSSSIGVYYVNSIDELHQLNLDKSYIVQELLRGEEITIDFAIDKYGRYLGGVPRKRLEVRAGEVSKGLTIKSPTVENLVKDLAEALPGAYGVLNVQVFLNSETDEATILEINPRFGGGYPLSHEAGANFITALLESNLGRSTSISWRQNLAMMRYDEAVYVELEAESTFGK